MRTRHSWQRTAFAVAVGVALCVIWFRCITASPIRADAGDSLQMAINLRHHGVISLDTEPPYTPTMYREPVPVVVTAMAVGLVDASSGIAANSLYFSGDRARFLKYVNLFWLGLLSISAFWALRYFGSSFWIALAGAAWVSQSFLSGSDTPRIDSLYSETPAAAVLLPASLLLAVGVCRRNLGLLIVAGLSFGVLALIKAMFLYVYAGLIVILALAYALRLTVATSRGGLREISVLVLAFAILVAPWMYRNYSGLSSFGISDRGGFVLHDRALLTQMTQDEYVGSFYAWSRESLQPIVGHLLGYSRADLGPGGRLQRLSRSRDKFDAKLTGNPESTETLYLTGRATRRELRNEFILAGSEQPGTAADIVLKERAIAMILDRPIKHLAITLPILWRSALIAFPLFLGGIIYCVRRRREDLALFCLPSFGLLMSLALLSSFIPRYSQPFRPVAIVLFIVLLQGVVAALTSRQKSIAGTGEARPEAQSRPGKLALGKFVPRGDG